MFRVLIYSCLVKGVLPGYDSAGLDSRPAGWLGKIRYDIFFCSLGHVAIAIRDVNGDSISDSSWGIFSLGDRMRKFLFPQGCRDKG
jgi:hypothetical protein